MKKSCIQNVCSFHKITLWRILLRNQFSILNFYKFIYNLRLWPDLLIGWAVNNTTLKACFTVKEVGSFKRLLTSDMNISVFEQWFHPINSTTVYAFINDYAIINLYQKQRRKENNVQCVPNVRHLDRHAIVILKSQTKQLRKW